MRQKIFGGKKEAEIWVRRTNEELSDFFWRSKYVGVTKAQKLIWMEKNADVNCTLFIIP